jgi:hypothetical protein
MTFALFLFKLPIKAPSFRTNENTIMKLTTTMLALLAATAFTIPAAQASITTVPGGLNPGDQYRLVFVTRNLVPNYGPDGGIEGYYSDIDVYNDAVSYAANMVPELAALGVDWKAIASTSAINARQNTGTDPSLGGVPIYLLNGDQFAANYADLWNIANKARDLNITETEASLSTSVWTGSDNDGAASSQHLGSTNPLRGNSQISSGSFATGPWGGGWVFDDSLESWQRGALYAMSGVLTVPGDPGVVPEPLSMFVWGGLALTAYWGKTSRRRG